MVVLICISLIISDLAHQASTFDVYLSWTEWLLHVLTY